MVETAGEDRHAAKRELRRELRRKLELLTPAVKAAAAATLCRRLAGDRRIHEAPWLAAFLALKSEPDLSAFLQARLARGLPVLLPKIVGDPKQGILEMRVVRSWGADFKPGALGILEPGEHCPVYVSTQNPVPANGGAAIDVVLVPGVAFDRDGHRMGRGGGHYDRFLQAVAAGRKIGVGFLCQRVAAVPVEPHDVQLDEVLLG